MSLARQGKVKQAETMMATDQGIPDDSLSLEVLAVIVTSQGDYSRSLGLWEQLLQREPQHAEAKRMVPAIQLWLSRPSWVRYVPAAAASLIVIFVAVAFWALTWEPPHRATPRRTIPASPSPIAPSGAPIPSPRLPPARTIDPGSPSPNPPVNFAPPKPQQHHR